MINLPSINSRSKQNGITYWQFSGKVRLIEWIFWFNLSKLYTMRVSFCCHHFPSSSSHCVLKYYLLFIEELWNPCVCVYAVWVMWTVARFLIVTIDVHVYVLHTICYKNQQNNWCEQKTEDALRTVYKSNAMTAQLT